MEFVAIFARARVTPSRVAPLQLVVASRRLATNPLRRIIFLHLQTFHRTSSLFHQTPSSIMSSFHSHTHVSAFKLLSIMFPNSTSSTSISAHPATLATRAASWCLHPSASFLLTHSQKKL